MHNRHTLTYLMDRLAAAGARPQKRFGQNFLIDLNVIEIIARTANLTDRDLVLEVGTGTGSLTGYLAQAAHHVITVEVDPFMQQIASDELKQFNNITLIPSDALSSKHTIDPTLVQLIDGMLAANENLQLKLVANLPYNIATPLMANLYQLDKPPVEMTVTIQLELAERFIAQPATKDYGALSVWIQSQADCEIVRKVPPHVFWPKPKVDSAILKVIRNDSKISRIQDRNQFHTFVKTLFIHRRKSIRNQLSSLEGVNSDRIDQSLKALSIQPNVRAEQLSVEAIIELYGKLLEV
jgi:16S rRNA (adenine1518-N6/adenine1519-N6)-dimethyltransferase